LVYLTKSTMCFTNRLFSRFTGGMNIWDFLFVCSIVIYVVVIVNLDLHYPHLLEFKLTLQNSTMFCTFWLIYLKHIYLIFPQRYHDSSNSILIADRQILILLIYLWFYLLYVFCLISNYKSKSSCSTQNGDIYMYIQTWVKRSLLGERKCGLIIHVTFQKRFNSVSAETIISDAFSYSENV
jgi:hypothetical protein